VKSVQLFEWFPVEYQKTKTKYPIWQIRAEANNTTKQSELEANNINVAQHAKACANKS